MRICNYKSVEWINISFYNQKTFQIDVLPSSLSLDIPPLPLGLGFRLPPSLGGWLLGGLPLDGLPLGRPPLGGPSLGGSLCGGGGRPLGGGGWPGPERN